MRIEPEIAVEADAGDLRGAERRAEPAGTAGSQFFVVTGQDAGLPPDYAVVGNVTDGLDVVDRIGKLGNAAEQPTRAVVISKVKVETS